MLKGKQTVVLDKPVWVESAVSVVGQKEGEGPLGKYFDVIVKDPMVDTNTWEEAESKLQEIAVDKLFEKSSVAKEDVRYMLAGDLLGQLIATSFGLEKYKIPLFGLYGACSTFGEAASLGAMLVAGGYGDNIIALASSHFASAEKQFRYPLEYGNQRPPASTWTVTGCGAMMLSSGMSGSSGSGEKKMSSGGLGSEAQKMSSGVSGSGEQKLSAGMSGSGQAKPATAQGMAEPSHTGQSAGKNIGVKIAGMTIGKIVDFGVKDSMNMGACMAPAAADLIISNFKDLEIDGNYYDKIITGDLGTVGRKILLDLLREKGIDIAERYTDCGIEIFDAENQDTKAGGSGCGCSAVTACSYIMHNLKEGRWKRVLLIPTGALLSTVSYNEGKSVPGIAHGVIFEAETEGMM